MFKALILAAFMSVSVSLAYAQQTTKVPRIGLLRAGSPPDPMIEAFRQGLRGLGYVEGKNIVIDGPKGKMNGSQIWRQSWFGLGLT